MAECEWPSATAFDFVIETIVEFAGVKQPLLLQETAGTTTEVPAKFAAAGQPGNGQLSAESAQLPGGGVAHSQHAGWHGPNQLALRGLRAQVAIETLALAAAAVLAIHARYCKNYCSE